MMRRLAIMLALLAAPFTARAELPAAPAPVQSDSPRTTLRRTSALEVGSGGAIFSRHLRYNDDVYGFLREYTLPAAPEATMFLRAYPGAFAGPGIGEVFGLELRFDRSFGVESERQNGVRFPTVQRVLEVNALARLARGGHELVGVVGYGHHAFELRRAEPSAPDLDNVPDVPSTGYGYVRLGVEGRAVLHDRVALSLAASYLFVLDAGGIEDDVWFPRAQTGGMTAGLGVVVAIVCGFEVRLDLEYRRYFLDMRVQPGDPHIAGGALDQYTRTSLRGVYRF